MLLIPLSALQKGFTGKINSLKKNQTSLKLMEMGLVPGEEVSLEAVSVFGDPIAIKLNNNIVSMRKKDANNILVEIDEKQ